MNAARIGAIAVTATLMVWGVHVEGDAMTFSSDPVTRHIHVAYEVPAQAPDVVKVVCTWSLPDADTWKRAKVMPLVSETALRLVNEDEWQAWVDHGRITERRAAGLERTVVFNPYPDAQRNGKVDLDFRVAISDDQGQAFSTQRTRIRVDNSDVVYVEDWSQVFQRDAVAPTEEAEGRKWTWRSVIGAETSATFGNMLYGDAGPETPLPQLSYPLDLKGWYAVFVHVPGVIRLRFTGDERADRLGSRRHEEVLWRWARMDRQHLVLKQSHAYTGCVPSAIDYVKFVPLTDDMVAALDGQFGKADKLIAGYWEPYSYAFSDYVEHALWHREYLTAYPEARIGIVDMQIGRFGMKVVYESRLTDQLLYATRGDPIGHVAHPTTDNVGRMQQYTNTLETSLQCAEDLGLRLHANFGASNCYPGSPLQGDFSKEHPDWMRGSALRFEVPEVRRYALSLYREALEIGAPGLSLDFCRYPETIDTAETCTGFLRELRALADEFGEKRGEHVPILVRFPGTGVRRCEHFDYATWAREGLVDYLCPSNIQGRHHHIDVAPYLAAVEGTECQVLPSVDGLSWGLPFPGAFLWRVAQLYDAGVPGLHIYQADSRVLGQPVDRRCMRLIASSEGVRQWWEEERRLRPRRSKGIYITPHHQIAGYHGWERLLVWTEGIEMGAVEFYLDAQLAHRCEGPPYLLGTEEYASDGIIPGGDHQLRIRAQDGDGWLEQTFAIHGAG